MKIKRFYLLMGGTLRQIFNGTANNVAGAGKNAKGPVIWLVVTVTSSRHVVVVKFPTDIDGQITTCKDIDYKMNHNSWIVVADVVPALVDVEAQITKVDQATAKAETHADGTAQARLVELGILKTLIYELAGFVQKICNKNPGHEKEIAQACGMDTRLNGGRQPYVDGVEATGIDGQVECTGSTKKKEKPLHEFQVTTDTTDAKKWYDIPITVTKKAKRKVNNLPINVDLYFRHRMIINDIPQEWGQLLHIKLTH